MTRYNELLSLKARAEESLKKFFNDVNLRAFYNNVIIGINAKIEKVSKK